MHPSRTRSALLAVASLLALVVAGLALAAPATAASTDVKINEFSSNSPDFIELINTGSSTVDLTGWVLKDSTENNSYTFPSGSSIAAGAIKGVSGENVEFAFGLGNGDAVRFYAPGGVLIDSFTYPAHPPAGKSYGRCPDGSGEIGITTAASKGAPNVCTTPNTAVRINEFSSNSPDFIELYNTATGSVDLSGWVLKDNSENNSYTFPAGSSIAGGAYKAISGENVEFAFGLGNGDAVRLYAPGAVLIDSYTYPAHPPAGKSYGRCPAGTGDFVITAAATKGAANDCPVPAGAANIKVNEIESDPNDLVELTNIGDAPVDISGYKLKDNDDTHVFTIAAGTTLGAHDYLVLDVNPSFGLGKGDSVRLYTPDGANLLDSTTYPADTHATTWGRCPDGTGTFGVTTSTLGAANSCGGTTPVVPDVKINEVESNGDQVADWVELKNLGTTAANVSGWKIVDGDASHAATPVVVPANTIIPAGGYYAIYTEINQSPGFGLGVGDSVNLFLPDGTTQVDTTTWGAHAATTWGRCPDGTGVFGDTTTSTRGLPNACSPIRINEIESDLGTPGDWVELKNISAASVDVSGWTIKDSADTSGYAIPAGTSIAANGYLVVEGADLGFGLGGADAVRLYDAGSALVESYAWTAHATQTYGRCKDGVGDFKDTKAPTKGAANSCPGLETSPWPGAQTVTTADLLGTFLQDLSGLVFDPADPDVLWAAQNKKGTLFKLVRDGDNFVPASGWPKDPKYLGGTGAPDTEGITIGPDGFVYLASERNNDASGVSRMSILRYDPAATGTTLTPTNEWNLTSQIPAAGANLGLEGVTYVPDSFLTGGGFVDQSTNAPYNPAGYPAHGNGVYFVAVEDTGDLIGFVLDEDGVTSHKVATIDSGFEHLADVDFDPELNRLRAVTDDTHDGKTSLLKLDAGAFVVDAAYDRPLGMPNLNNEGLAVAPQSRCVDGKKEVLWSDDGDTDGHSLRRGSINCTPAKSATTTSVAVTATRLTATVTAPGSAVPSGTVEFRVDDVLVGTAPVILGTAILDHVVPTGAEHQVVATYGGNDELLGSTGSVARKDPTITAAVSSAVPKNAAGWYRTPVTVTFTCTPNGSALAGPCPAPVTLTADGVDQVVSRSIAAQDGGAASATVTDLDIDTTAPTAALTRVRQNFVYIFGGDKPPAECVPADALSGIASCTVTHTRSGSRWTSTAVATDKAGNTTAFAVSYTALVLFAKD
ncbi:lamin tail domain-containing protein [Nocardioides marmoriginsengisoli]|uniref:lamin tail domain-containing protein n=1 Tax=Nocardioides marmoriginsengisoli TaxID=661483 RepID=UPI001C829A77|nr:lamin tail domain-containing protein [Nocardioides marmoriginsengisoli]